MNSEKQKGNRGAKKMLTSERRERIAKYVQENGAAGVQELTKLFSASEATIRRDLAALAAAGKLNKVHGGALLPAQEYLNREDVVLVKMQNQYEEKLRIASYAASLVRDDDYVFLDAGSTTLLMTRFLSGKKAVFLTNGIAQAGELAKVGCRAMILGGDLKETTEAVIGSVAAAHLQKYNFSKAFIGTNGISLRQGFTTTNTGEAVIKAIAAEHSFQTFVLADHTKFGRVSAVGFAPLASAAVLCDYCPDEEIKKKTEVREVDGHDLHDDAESRA